MQSETDLILTHFISKIYKAHEEAVKNKIDFFRIQISKEEKERISNLSETESTMDMKTLAMLRLFQAIILGPVKDGNIDTLGEISVDCITKLKTILGK